MTQEFYKIGAREAPGLLKTDAATGLTAKEAQKRLTEHGPNEIRADKGVSALGILLHNANNLIVYLLGAAAALSFYMNDIIEGVAVLIALSIAVLTGFFMELRAQKSVLSLQKMIFTTAKARRDGRLIEIPSTMLVPGDIIFLEEGDSVSADCRLLSSNNFACIESALTGESQAVEKDASAVLAGDVPIGDRVNMAYAGTAVTRGNAYAAVTCTGMQTETGKIMELLEGRGKVKTPLHREMDKLSRLLILAAFIAAAAVLIVGVATRQPLEALLHIALILAVAAIPEAMPAVSTITLSRGMKKMAEHKALVKSLPAVETLGSTSVICTDKTGTLTENQMTVEKIVLANEREFDVEGNGYLPAGEIRFRGEVVDVKSEPELSEFITAAVLASNATLKKEDRDYGIIGDPTEGALVVLGEKTGMNRDFFVNEGWERTGELPFDSSKKYMATAYAVRGGNFSFIKGAPDVLLGMSRQSGEVKAGLFRANDALAKMGMRVLAVARLAGYDGDGGVQSIQAALNRVEIIGLAGIIDPPRKDAREAVTVCQEAGIRVKMITGDHPGTASIIAREIGLLNYDSILTGSDIDRGVNEEGFARRADETAVFARVSPENKIQIVDALRAAGEIVAMTGDGVNDAPALNGADIGVAMGIRGTEVAKEASDMILTDDRFSTIVDAVREGRIIFSNIRKYVFFLFSCNMVEIFTVLLSLMFLLPLPVLPLHILVLNLLIDVAPAMALAFEPAEKGIMREPPRDTRRGLVGRAFLVRILLCGMLIGLGSFLIFRYFYSRGSDLNYAQTAAFSFMAVGQLIHVLNVRKEKGFGLFSLMKENRLLLGAAGVSLLILLLVVYTPALNGIIGTTPLDLKAWLILLPAAALTTLAVYIVKKLIRANG